MLIKRKNINKIDNHGFEKSREKSLHDSGPGYQRDGYSSSYSSVHSYPGDSKKGMEISEDIEKSMRRMENEMEDLWKF